jgi:hypothetical protein
VTLFRWLKAITLIIIFVFGVIWYIDPERRHGRRRHHD